MPKLNKTEISVLAKRISEELVEETERKYKAAIGQEDLDNISKAIKIYDELRSLSKEARNILRGKIGNAKKTGSPITQQAILESLRVTKESHVSKYTFYHDVYDELILCNSSTEDRGSLQHLVTNRFLSKI